jgi:hypothetical protein
VSDTTKCRVYNFTTLSQPRHLCNSGVSLLEVSANLVVDVAQSSNPAQTVPMPLDILFILALPALVAIGMVLQYLRARRRGLRGRSALIAIFTPVRILMQGEAAGRGLPASRLEVVDTHTSDGRPSAQPR